MKFKIFNTESEFNFEIIDLQNLNIFLHKNLKINQKFEEFLLQNNGNNALSVIYHPIFLKKEDSKETKYYLVARHFVYSFYISQGITSFSAIVIDDEKLLPEIFELEQSEFYLLDNAIHTSRITSNNIDEYSATKTRHEAIQAGQICPFCSGNLRRSRKKERSEKGGYKISCEKNIKKSMEVGKGCDFEAFLTEVEFKLFMNKTFPTSQWLQPIKDKKCPKCKDTVYLRAIYKSNNVKESIERCRKFYSKHKKCDYYLKK